MTKVIIFNLLTITISGVIASDWWEHGSFYEIYPRSFNDTNDDGIGDLNGIIEKLSYLQELGVTGIWLSSIFQSAMYDIGYDVTDYMLIHPDYGTMTDFKNLVEECNKLDIKVILDLIPNHSSDEHEWFKKSADGDPYYADFYIWHPGRKNGQKVIEPNNWLSVVGGSAWIWNKQRNAYYLHQFSHRQPDLNFRNKKVQERFLEIIEFWLNSGVSGFHFSAISHLLEAKADQNGVLLDEPISNQCDNPKSYCYLDHIHTTHQSETFEVVYLLRKLLDDYKKQHSGNTRVLMLDVYGDKSIIQKYYGDGEIKQGAQIPFNFEL